MSITREKEQRAPQKTGPGASRRPAISAAALALGALLGELLRRIGQVADRAIEHCEHWLVDAKHARRGLAVTRILLGLTALGLLATNFRTRYYAFGSGSAWNGEAANPTSDFPNIWLFSGFNRIALNDAAFTIAYLALAVLAVLVALGWRMKIVLPVFLIGWISFIEMNPALGDQGDNMFRITVLSLLFADTASCWSLDARRRARIPADASRPQHFLWGGHYLPAWLTNTMHNLVLVAVAFHVCFVYASGALYKAGGAPWQQGYAIYNPLMTEHFGPWPEIGAFLTTWAPMVTIISWTSIILQMLFPMMLLRRPTRIIALFGICSFHIGIAILLGLPWFSLAMIAIDAIFVRDVTWQYVTGRIRTAWHTARTGNPPPDGVRDDSDRDMADRAGEPRVAAETMAR